MINSSKYVSATSSIFGVKSSAVSEIPKPTPDPDPPVVKAQFSFLTQFSMGYFNNLQAET